MRLYAPLFALMLACQLVTANCHQLVEGSNAFTLALYHEMSDEQESFVVSPFNLSTALSMAYIGAAGATAGEMAGALHYPVKEPALIATDFCDLFEQLQRNEARLDLANSVWFDGQQTLLPSYREVLERDYQGALHQVDFTQTEEVRRAINRWTAEQTQGKVDELLQAGDLESTTSMVLASAIYLKAAWQSPFDAAATRESPFMLSRHASVNVPMMHQTLGALHHQGTDFELLTLPYCDELAMLLVLPTDPEGLPRVEEQLSVGWFAQALAAMDYRQVELELPRFEMRTRLEPRAVLEQLGMRDPFGMHADFSGIGGERDLFIDTVVQEAFIAVDEQGTEAGAATAVGIGVKSYLPPKAEVQFRVDHPFLYMIFDIRTGQFLFIGRVLNPKVA